MEAQRRRFVTLQVVFRLRPTATLSDIESSCSDEQQDSQEEEHLFNNQTQDMDLKLGYRRIQAKHPALLRITRKSTKGDSEDQISETSSYCSEDSLPSLLELERTAVAPITKQFEELILSTESSSRNQIHQIENTCLPLQDFD